MLINVAKTHLAHVYQLLREAFHNPKVGGSIPPPATNVFNDLRRANGVPFFVCHAPVT